LSCDGWKISLALDVYISRTHLRVHVGLEAGDVDSSHDSARVGLPVCIS